MTEYVVTASARPSVSVAGREARFPVRRILCVGRNYADHALEMGGAPDREPPFFFAKPADAAVSANGIVPYPSSTARLEHEVELVVAIGVGGTDLDPATALDHVWGYGVGVDLTRRDRQQEAKDARRPWDLAKGFDSSAPMTALMPASQSGHPASGRIWLAVNGEVRQQGDLQHQIWPVAEVIAAASRAWELQPGDLLFTGTPAGVGPLESGDVVTGGIDGVGEFEFTVGASGI